jgi:hypothetical protein
MQKLMKLFAGLERLMAAATFAEAGCWDTARGILNEEKQAAGRRPSSRTKARPDQRPVLRV